MTYPNSTTPPQASPPAGVAGASFGGPPWGAAERRHFFICVSISAVLILLAAVFSIGFEHPDEYFQILEFAATKLGLTSIKDLPWEYREQMRSWLQPALYIGIARAAALVGVERPFTLMLVFRLCTGLISWIALWSLVVAGRRWIADETNRRALYTSAALLWFLPYLAVRTSSETLSTAMLCLALVVLEWRAVLPGRAAAFCAAFLAGLLLGLCTELRFPSGVMATGAAAWYLWFARDRVILFAGLAIGGLSALVLGCAADWWGYGHPAFPAYSYVYQNFVMGRSEQFGTAYFFAYLYIPLATLTAPLIVFLMAATIAGWFRRPLHVLTWTTAPYVALLCAVPHKEARFLFPLAPFVPFFVVFATASAPLWGQRVAAFLRRMSSGAWFWFGQAVNAVGLLTIVLLPLPAEMPLYKLLAQKSYAVSGMMDIAVAQVSTHVPYGQWGLPMTFIKPVNLRLTLNPSPAALDDRLARGPFLGLIDIAAFETPGAVWLRDHCQFEWSFWPLWLRPYNFFGWQEEAFWWELYRCGGAVP